MGDTFKTSGSEVGRVFAGGKFSARIFFVEWFTLSGMRDKLIYGEYKFPIDGIYVSLEKEEGLTTSQ